MTSADRIKAIKQNHTALKIQFIKTELDMAATFCEVGATTSQDSAFERNLENAKKAYETASKALRGLRLNPEDSREISEQLGKAKSSIADLERIKPSELQRSHP